jgi:RHS repeat-associated protein
MRLFLKALAGFAPAMILVPTILADAGDPIEAPMSSVGPEMISANPFTGSASTSYGFVVPPGRSGMTPSVSIHYNSSNTAPSELGRGWSFAFPHIQRSTRHGQPSFSWTDTFTLTWNRGSYDLTMICDENSGCAPGVREYRTVVESFLRIRSYSFAPALTYWEIEDGGGRKYQFGRDMPDGPWAQVNDSHWALNRVEDQYGNYMTFRWLIHLGTMYPREIRYAGNSVTSLQPTNRVEFDYEGRRDDSHTLLGVRPGGSPREMFYRLVRIRSWAGSQIASVYIVKYSTDNGGAAYPTDMCAETTCGTFTNSCGTCTIPCDPATGFCASSCTPECSGGGGGKPRSVVATSESTTDVGAPSLLTRIERYNASGTESLPSTWFSYQPEGTASFAAPVGDVPVLFTRLFCNSHNLVSLGTQFAEINGDGLPDLLQGRRTGCDGQSSRSVYINSNGSWIRDDSYVLPEDFVMDLCGFGDIDHGLRVIDINSDGLDDLVRSVRPWVGGWAWGQVDAKVWLNNGHGWTLQPPGAWNVPTAFIFDSLNGEETERGRDVGVRFGDVNGDGRIDLIRRRDENSQAQGDDAVFLNTGSGWALQPGWRVPLAFANRHYTNYDPGTRVLDINGDRLADLVRSYDWCNQHGCESYQHVYLGRGGSNGTTNMDNVWTLVDGQWFGNGQWVVPEPFVKITNEAKKTVSVDLGVRFADVNGDGEVDIVRGYNNQQADASFVATKRVHLGRAGAGWSESPAWSAALPYTFSATKYSLGISYDEGTRLVDLDGNGTADMVKSFDGRVCGGTLVQERRLNTDGASDLLTSMKNSMGGTTSLRYEPATKFDNRVRGAAPGARSYLGFAFPVVVEMTSNDVGTGLSSGVGNVYTTTYDYQGGFFHHGRREFRGFRYVRTNFPGGRAYAEQLFVQDRSLEIAPLVGAVERQATRRTADGAVYAASLSWFDRSDAAVPIYHHPSRSESYLYDWTVTAPIDGLSAAGARRSVGTANAVTFDANGFIASREVQSLGDLSTSGDDLYETSELINDPTRWLVGRPKRVTVRDAPGGGGARLADSWFFYDGLSHGQIGAQGNLTSAERWSGLPGDGPGAAENRRVTLGADAYGHVTFRQDEEGHRVLVDYGSAEPTLTFPVSTRVITSESGTTVEHRGDYQYDLRFGKVVSATVTGGGTVSSQFDGFGRLSKTWHSLDSAALPTTCYIYGTGYPRSVVRYDREYSGYGASCGTLGMIERADFYDGRGRHVQSRVQATPISPPKTNVISTKKYDAEGRLATEFSAFSTSDYVTYYTEPPSGTLTTTFAYDAVGRPTAMTPPGVPTIRTSYSDWTTAVVDAEGRKTESDRDAQGRVVERRTYTGSAEPYALYSRNTLEYDRRGHLRYVRDNADNAMEYRYNDLGELTTIIDPDGGTITREYYRDGLLKRTTDAAGRSVFHTYDSLHRPLVLTRTSDQQTATTRFLYDEPLGGPAAMGHLTSVVDSLTGYRQEFVYDIIGRPRISRYFTDVRPEPYEVSRELDTLGRTVTLTYPDGPVPSRVRYLHGADGQPTAVVNDLTAEYIASNVQYRPNGALERIDYANGVSHSRTFNAATERVERYRAVVLGTGQPVADWTYFYKPGGHLESIVDAVGTGSETFGLDDMYRLTSATAPASYGSLSFAYDSIGNMTRKEGMTFQYPDPSHPHRAMTTSSGLSLDYDASGNVEAIVDDQGQGRVFTYDVDGRIASVTDNVTGKQVFYAYDPSGDRIKVREVNGAEETSTLFLGDLYEEQAGFGKKYVYLAGTRVAEWRADGTKLFHTSNHLGSLSVVTDQNGADVQRIEYKPYGEISRVHSTTFATSFGFAGAVQDTVSGLKDFGARSYDPLLGRFISIDPIVSDPLDLNAMNPYGYGLGNPASYVDVGGLFASFSWHWFSQFGATDPIDVDYFEGVSLDFGALPWSEEPITEPLPSPPPAANATPEVGLAEGSITFEAPISPSPITNSAPLPESFPFAPSGYGSGVGIGVAGLAYTSSMAAETLDGQSQGGFLDTLQAGLDVASLALDASVVGAPFSFIPDLVNAGISLGRGDIVGAGLSAAAVLPGIGAPANAARLARAATAIAPSSRVLGRALEAAGHLRPADAAAHHIAAGSARAADPARAVLGRFGIGINEAANGMFLPRAVHTHLHTNAYYDAVNLALGQATTRQEALEALGAIRADLARGIFP